MVNIFSKYLRLPLKALIASYFNGLNPDYNLISFNVHRGTVLELPQKLTSTVFFIALYCSYCVEEDDRKW